MNHNSFILLPIEDILKDVTSASIGVDDGIETFPLCDYVMQSVFLRMTGAQEQKMKCISWELATNDYEYRYDRYSKNPLGECSTYKEKKLIYQDLIQQIEKLGVYMFNQNLLDSNRILQTTTNSINSIFQGSNLLVWAQKSFNDYVTIWDDITISYFADDKNNLFKGKSNLPLNIEKGLMEIYDEHLYKHRNRVAHNTLSYQQNLPTLTTLVNEDYRYNNYFIYFSILILIDNIMISLYNTYLKSLDESKI